MARIYLYPLFLLLIVFAFRLDFNEAAAFPPPGYRTRCLLVVEAEKVNGIYRYDPEEQVDSGYPKMVKLRYTPGKKLDYNKVDEDYYLAYSSVWIFFYRLRFSHGGLRLAPRIMHPCNGDAGLLSHWKIYLATLFHPIKGYAQLADDIVELECVPRHGLLTSKIKYKLPAYDNNLTSYGCVSWLRKIELESGVKSHATAAQVDVDNFTCTLFYENHSDMTEKSGDQNYCLLEETGPPGDYPGFYKGCEIYVEDPVFAGLWELDYTKQFHSMPYLGLRRADHGNRLKERVVLHNDFKAGFTARLNKKKLQFLKNNAVGLEFEMEAHFCIGPDLGQEVQKETSRTLSVAYRKDKGIKCIPFYTDASFIKDNSVVTKTVSLHVPYTLGHCVDYLTEEFPSTDWQAIKSTINVGPCLGFEYRYDYDSVEDNESDNTYSCFFTT